MPKLGKVLATVAVVLAFAGAGETIIPTVTASASSYVVIAPRYGRKSHHSKHCRGLSHARSKKYVTKSWARSHHRPLCHWCYR